MCTAMTMQFSQGNYFGRTMDFSYPLDPELFFVPAGYRWNNLLRTHNIQNQYSYMGIGQDISPVIFADGVNEMGFAAAVLYFPGYAQYDPATAPRTSKPPIAALELVNFLLGLCGSVKQAAELLPSIQIVGTEDPITNSTAPLHWILADQSGACLTVEKMADGLHLSDNSIGVLSNSPDFSWHMTNLRNYMNVTPEQKSQASWGMTSLSPFGQGAGTTGLPGDYTPPSRFVRTAYLKSHITPPADKTEAVLSCFHVMENVTIPKGVVVTDRGTSDYTQYTAFVDLSRQEYYYKSYGGTCIRKIAMPERQSDPLAIMSLGKLAGPAVFSS
ncbi:choloylglycine hydrolase family protein [Anaerolentibacter hominis]|uniref:choloylglycine hydrolase family protein n=1 Tax=Anaerolentibacter hominis TaxID=3079009 RepID=UPI0031B87923